MAKSVANFLGLSCLFILLHGIHAVEYTVANTTEAARFNREIGVPYTKATLNSSTLFIWKIFQQDTPDANRITLEKVSLFVDDTDSARVAYTVNDQIHVSAKYIENYPGHVRREFTGILYHELTRIWQWNCNGQAPQWLVLGIADYVRLRAGFAPSYWVKPGQGERWDKLGQGVTARFLDFCHSWKDCIVADLNKNMRSGYDEKAFVATFGMTSMDQLWAYYKVNYNVSFGG